MANLVKQQFEISLKKRGTRLSLPRSGLSVGLREEGGECGDGLTVEVYGSLAKFRVVLSGLWITNHPAGARIRTEWSAVLEHELGAQKAEEHRAWVVATLLCRRNLRRKETCKVDYVSTAGRLMPVCCEEVECACER
jgi:hypothetical protein